MEWAMAVVELWQEMHSLAIHEHGARRDDSANTTGRADLDLLLDTAHRALRRWKYWSRLLSSFQDRLCRY